MGFFRRYASLDLCAFGVLAFSILSWGQSDFVYAPRRLPLPLTQSVLIDSPWRDSIRFIANRGDDRVSMLQEVQRILDPREIRRLPGYSKPSKTRITLMTYELRSVEVANAIQEGVEAGFHFRVVADPSTFRPFAPATKKQLREWSDHQRDFYFRKYDFDGDDSVTQSDADQVNRRSFLGIEIWKRLESFAKVHPKRLELVSSPYQVVPSSDFFAFPHLTHYKYYAVEFMLGGKWVPVRALIGSANLTDSCLNIRVGTSTKNLTAYLNGKDSYFTPGSEGNIQFGAVLTGAGVLEPYHDHIEQLIGLYRKGLHFDEAKPRETLFPRVVFQQKNLSTPSSLQGFFSEGTRLKHRQAVDPVLAVMDILSSPGVKLRVYYDAQFVFAHQTQALTLRTLLADPGVEDVFVAVDQGFATQYYSALPTLLFAPRLENTYGVLPERAIQDFPKLDPKLNWQKHVFVYDGNMGVLGKNPDKLHSKVSYFEYLDGDGVRHYLVVWGSGNRSSNAGRLNADGLWIFDSVDPEVGKQVRPFFDGLRAEVRMRPYVEDLMEHEVLEKFVPRENIYDPKFIKKIADLLSAEKKLTTSWRAVIKRLSEAGTINSYGDNFLALLIWFNESVDRPLTWTDFSILLELAYPNKAIQPGFAEGALTRWYGHGVSPSERRAFRRIVGKLSKTPTVVVDRSNRISRILAQCEGVLTRIFPSDKGVMGGAK